MAWLGRWLAAILDRHLEGEVGELVDWKGGRDRGEEVGANGGFDTGHATKCHVEGGPRPPQGQLMVQARGECAQVGRCNAAPERLPCKLPLDELEGRWRMVHDRMGARGFNVLGVISVERTQHRHVE